MTQQGLLSAFIIFSNLQRCYEVVGVHHYPVTCRYSRKRDIQLQQLMSRIHQIFGAEAWVENAAELCIYFYTTVVPEFIFLDCLYCWRGGVCRSPLGGMVHWSSLLCGFQANALQRS